MTEIGTVRRSRGRYAYLWMFLALVGPAAVFAFVKSYAAGLTFSGLPMTALIHVHAASMALWIVMLAAQAWLVRTRRNELHRLVGRSSFVIAPLIVLLTVWVVHFTLNRKSEVTTLDARLEIYDLMQVAGFGLAWALAIVYRRKIALHMRFMVSTVFALGNAILFRILMSWFQWVPGLNVSDDPDNLFHIAILNGALLVLALLALIALDWRAGIRRSPYWLVTVTTTIIHVGLFTFAKSDWWMAAVRWFAGLSL